MVVNTTAYEQTEQLKLFIENFANVNAVNIPGRVAGYNSEKLMLLPTLHNKLLVYEKYQTACEDPNHQPVYRFFDNCENCFFPYVFATKPRTELDIDKS